MLMSGEVTAALGGDAYHGTILLADIIGFTAMSEKMPPARVVAKLNRYFTLLSAKFERLDDLESRLQADLDNICETFNVARRSIKFEKWRTTP